MLKKTLRVKSFAIVYLLINKAYTASSQST